LDIAELAIRSRTFETSLTKVKERLSHVSWYPYTTMANLGILDQMLTGSRREVLPEQAVVLDIGAADGDLGFFLESVGAQVDVVDHPQTNFNNGLGLLTLHRELNSKLGIIFQDIDQPFVLPRQYDLGVALGILYHLRNPLAFLISLALHCKAMVLSTRVAKFVADVNVSEAPIGYLLEKREANNDSTNFWIFSRAGLFRALTRSGWVVRDFIAVGDTEHSNPADSNRDERLFVYCERVPNYAELRVHHDF
jgi:hypothetical protein